MANLLLVHNETYQEVQMGQEITIGRAYSNLLRLEGEEISRVHAIIYRRGGDYVLRDLDSKNGAYLNGERVTTSLVEPGDEIRIGNYILLFDPSSDYDVTGFLRKHNCKPATGTEKPAGADPDTNAMPEENVEVLPDNGDQVFFSLAEVEGWSDTQALRHSAGLLTDLLRMNRALAVTQIAEDTEDETAVYQHFLNAAVAAVGADRGVIVLRDEARDVLKLGAIVSQEKDVAVNRVVLRSVLREHKAVLCNDPVHDPRFQETDTIQKERISSLIAFPLVRGDVTLGLVYADAQDRTGAFRKEHLLVLHFLSRMLVLYLPRVAARQ